jgi:transcriptional regulator with XRE-family HTH domain
MQVSTWRTGAFVRKLRLEQGLTQWQLAHLAGEPCEVEDIYRLERGMAGAMRPDHLEQILAVMQSDLAALYQWCVRAEEMRPAASEQGASVPVVSQVRELAPAVGKFDHARQRLQAAMFAARETRNRSVELLAVSRNLRDGWSGTPPPTGLDLSSQC